MFLLKRNNILSKGLYIIYVISAVSAILFVYLSPTSIFLYKTSYEPLFYLFFVLLIVFNGFSTFDLEVLKLNKKRYKVIELANMVGWFYLPVALLLLYNAINVLVHVDLSSYRMEANFYSTGLFKGGVFLSLCIYLSELFFVPQFLLFYVLQFKKVGKGLIFRLLFSSFSFTFMTLMFAGRDGIVFWVMDAIIFYYFFRDSYAEEVKKKVKKGSIVVFIIILIPFLTISVARFLTAGSSSFSESITPFISYIGQSPHIFCQSFYVDGADIRGTDYRNLSRDVIDNFQVYLGWTFGTFVKPMIWSFGKYGTIAVALLFNISARLLSKMHNKKNDVWSLFIIIMLYQIPYWGVFYYRYSINNMEIVYSLFAIICFIMYTYQNKIKKVIKKNYNNQ